MKVRVSSQLCLICKNKDWKVFLNKHLIKYQRQKPNNNLLTWLRMIMIQLNKYIKSKKWIHNQIPFAYQSNLPRYRINIRLISLMILNLLISKIGHHNLEISVIQKLKKLETWLTKIKFWRNKKWNWTTFCHVEFL